MQMSLKISEIQIIPVKASDGLVGFTSFVIENSFYMGGIGIYTRPQGGIRLTYPIKNHPSGAIPIFHPINNWVGEQICDAVSKKYNEVMLKIK